MSDLKSIVLSVMNGKTPIGVLENRLKSVVEHILTREVLPRLPAYSKMDETIRYMSDNGKIALKQLSTQSEIKASSSCNYYVFTGCKNVTPESISIQADRKDIIQQISFYDASGEVYFKKAKLGDNAKFSNLVRNYWTYISWDQNTANAIELRKQQALSSLNSYVSDVINASNTCSAPIQSFMNELGPGAVIGGFVSPFSFLKKIFSNEEEEKRLREQLRKQQCEMEQQRKEHRKLLGKQMEIIMEKEKEGMLQEIDNVVEKVREKNGYKGCYSIIGSLQVLEIENSNGDEQPARDLLDYVKCKYLTGQHWHFYQLSRNMEISINLKGHSLQLEVARKLRKYFNKVSINTIRAPLQIENLINQECGSQFIFTVSRQISPQKLVIDAKLKGKDDEVLILFSNANNEIYIPDITICEQGSLAAIVRNGNDAGKSCYSLIQNIQMLTIRNNSEAFRDFTSYIKGVYNTSSKWPVKKLRKEICIIIEQQNGNIELESIKMIAKFSINTLVNGQQAKSYIAIKELGSYWGAFKVWFDEHGLPTEQHKSALQVAPMTNLTGHFHIRGGDQGIRLLNVDQKLGENQFVCFHDVGAPVQADRVCIGAGGDLRSVVQNAYYDGKAAGFFNLLETARELEVRNIQAAHDIVDYVDRKYPINKNWGLNRLGEGMKVEINLDGSAVDLDVVEKLRSHFTNVAISGINQTLAMQNTISQECGSYAFKNSRGVDQPCMRLSVNARLTGNAGPLVCFDDADGEVCIKELVIGARGNIDAITCNRWCNGKSGDESRSGTYGLISHADALTIVGNHQAVRDLARYVEDQQLAQNIRREMRVTIQKADESDLKPIKIIAEYLAEVKVDGQDANLYVAIKELGEYWGPVTVYFRQFGLKIGNTTCYDASSNRGVSIDLTSYMYNIKNVGQQLDSIIVSQSLQTDQFVCFHDMENPVSVDDICIQKCGNLRSVLQNAYYKDGRHGFFSLLDTARTLKIKNPQAVRDLADLVNGQYTLNENWNERGVSKNIEINIVIENPQDLTQAIQQIANHFKIVAVNKQLVKRERLPNACVNGRYIVQKELGRGAWGIAYLVESDAKSYVLKDIDIEKVVKSLERNGGDDIEIEEEEEEIEDEEETDSKSWKSRAKRRMAIITIKQEIETLRKCNHRNVVKYEESFIDGDVFCVIMEYCDSGDLQGLLKERKKSKTRLTEEEVFRYFVQICLAVKHIHEKKILHRDLKDANVFLSKPKNPEAKEFQVKVGDFGLSRAMQNQIDLAETIVGTPYFMAPEIMFRQKYNNKCDIWSLGCILYKMCALEDVPKFELLQHKIPSVLDYGYSENVQHIINFTFRLDPSERYSIIEILDEILKTEQVREWTEDLFTQAEINKIQPKSKKTKGTQSTAKQQQKMVQEIMSSSNKNQSIMGRSARIMNSIKNAKDTDFGDEKPTYNIQQIERALNEIKNDIIEQYGERQYTAWCKEIWSAQKASRPPQDVPKHVVEYVLFENEIRETKRMKQQEERMKSKAQKEGDDE